MSTMTKIIFLLFWMSVFGMIFGTNEIKTIFQIAFYLCTPAALISGLYEVFKKRKP